MALPAKKPVDLLSRIQSDLNDFFKLQGKGFLPSIFEEPDVFSFKDWAPSVDIKENRKQFSVTVDVPGIDPKDIEVSMENGCLSIRGERKEEREKVDDNHRLKECSYGSFERSFRLPETADANKISAKGKHGVLAITIGKKKATKPRAIKIES